MSEYIVRMPPDMPYEIKAELNAWYVESEPIVRCRDCDHGDEVVWPKSWDVPDDYLDCTGPLVTTWDYYNDEPKSNPVPPDGYCAWGERGRRSDCRRLLR